MTWDEYQLAAHSTSGQKEFREQIAMAALGLCGESGEVADLIKKKLFHHHYLPINELEKELGDVLWYLAEMCTAFNITLEEVAIANIAKLRDRYPDGFSSERSINR